MKRRSWFVQWLRWLRTIFARRAPTLLARVIASEIRHATHYRSFR